MTVATHHAPQIEHTAPRISSIPIPSAPSNETLNPTSWWRIKAPDQFRSTDAHMLRRVLRGTTLSGQPDWRFAINGRVTTAIRIAIDTLKIRGMVHSDVDLVISALLASAIDGDVTAGILISSALRRRARITPRCRLLADLWLVTDYNFAVD